MHLADGARDDLEANTRLLLVVLGLLEALIVEHAHEVALAAALGEDAVELHGGRGARADPDGVPQEVVRGDLDVLARALDAAEEAQAGAAGRGRGRVGGRGGEGRVRLVEDAADELVREAVEHGREMLVRATATRLGEKRRDRARWRSERGGRPARRGEATPLNLKASGRGLALRGSVFMSGYTSV